MQLRTLFDGGPAEEYCQQAILTDLAGARLSSAFRAYYRVRPLLPIAVRQRLQQRRNQRMPQSDDWFLPTEFLRGLSRLLPKGSKVEIWPDAHRFALVLTHDVETAEGLRRVPAIADMEEGLGLRSCWNLVPYKYAIDQGLVRDLQQRGFEIGVHGYNHDGRLFWSEKEFRRRAPMIAAAARQLGAVGFRAPMVHRNLDWIQRLPFEYDASCFDVDPYQAMPGGVGQLWPFFAGEMVELPYTLPQDHTLFVTLGETSDRVWRQKLGHIEEWSGMALLLTHPDYLDTPALLEVYRGFLEYASNRSGVWHALPREAACLLRERAQRECVA
ncbi:MAG: hypothetical protein KDA37_18235 [Planctomycetales bacterium]|nr:hypothetical protein [Planctomycetales bacterium]